MTRVIHSYRGAEIRPCMCGRMRWIVARPDDRASFESGYEHFRTLASARAYIDAHVITSAPPSGPCPCGQPLASLRYGVSRCLVDADAS